LHLGHARTFFIAWLAARQAGGRIILRIEDIDASRVRADALQGAIDDLRWLGLDWDEGPDCGGPHAPYLQSERRAAYEQTLESLKRAGYVYPCTCTRADIARAAAAPHAEDRTARYPGTCASRRPEDAVALGDVPYAWRFRVPSDDVAWDDLVMGRVRVNPAQEGGDFVVGRSSGEPAYQLAVVHDDATMGINQVIRGDDLVESTPRQILLYRALGWDPPQFGHVPLVLGPDGRRLAKREGSIKLATLRAREIDPRRLVGWLALSCGLSPELQPSLPADWLSQLALANLRTTTWQIDPEVLADLGAE
jgi:glutamyl-tRNA synthetase